MGTAWFSFILIFPLSRHETKLARIWRLMGLPDCEGIGEKDFVISEAEAEASERAAQFGVQTRYALVEAFYLYTAERY